MTIENFNNSLFKKDQNKFNCIKLLNGSECKFVRLKNLKTLVNINIFYRNIYKECNKLYLDNEFNINDINNYDIIQISNKDIFYNYTTIKIKIEEYLKLHYNKNKIRKLFKQY